MKAIVDPGKCVGCELCAGTCPEVFVMKEGKAVAVLTPVPKNLEETAKQAASECPVEAIIVT
ncbi:MAG: ferredoxin [Candidatus Omnitrophica bacterium]|nr:ferredoxin [Candidatus Omnitrophota bacterium]